ncbi:hypothetical protein [Clostridium sardiniense]|uniref:hypothetical protein n=1 Tax=Clostridium sardiniense TaxID=29369 RepID=UPI003D34846D
MNNEENIEMMVDFFLNDADSELVGKALRKKSKINMDLFDELYLQLKDMHEFTDVYKGIKAKTKGELLEDMIKVLILNTSLFSLFDNITNDSNEYDIITKLSEKGQALSKVIPEELTSLVICECKNYQDTIGVTWIGKLYSLLELSDLKLGIIFSYEPLTGMKIKKDEDYKEEYGWKDANGLTRKIFLKKGIYIININKEDYEAIHKKEKGIFDIIEKKCEELRILANIEKEKKNHPSQVNVEKIKDKIANELQQIEEKKKK